MGHSSTNSSCADYLDYDDPDKSHTAKASILPAVKTALPNEPFEDYTQFGIDFVMFGIAQRPKIFESLIPLFSKDFHLRHRKAKMMRMVL